MKKAYLMVYSATLGDSQDVKECLTDLPEVHDWRTDLPTSFYIISEHSAKKIARAIHSRLGNGRFILTEITKNTQGFLPKESWHLINKKTRYQK